MGDNVVITSSADWHLGVLAFNQGTAREDWYFSGVYIEVLQDTSNVRCGADYLYIQSGTLTTSLRSGGLGGSSVTTTASKTTASKTTTTTTAISTISLHTSTSSPRTTSSSTTTARTTFDYFCPNGTTQNTPCSTTASPTTTASGATQTHYGQVKCLSCCGYKG